MPNVLEMACGNNTGSCNPPSSTSHTPSAKARPTSLATRNANRDLPTPPTPVRVTNRDDDNNRRTSDSSSRRPTKLLNSAGIAATQPTLADYGLCEYEDLWPAGTAKWC